MDYPKSGRHVEMPKELRPTSWPHFIQRKNTNQYPSKKILGQLYDAIVDVNRPEQQNGSFDDRILNKYTESCFEILIAKAQELKIEYDAAIKAVMAHHEIATEFEVWTAFVLSHNQERKDYSFAEELGLISQDLTLKFRKLCIEAAGGETHDKIMPFVAAMYKVTAREASEATKTGNSALISFPWIFHRELGQIATSKQHVTVTKKFDQVYPLQEGSLVLLEDLPSREAVQVESPNLPETNRQEHQNLANDETLSTTEGSGRFTPESQPTAEHSPIDCRSTPDDALESQEYQPKETPPTKDQATEMTDGIPEHDLIELLDKISDMEIIVRPSSTESNYSGGPDLQNASISTVPSSPTLGSDRSEEVSGMVYLTLDPAVEVVVAKASSINHLRQLQRMLSQQ